MALPALTANGSLKGPASPSVGLPRLQGRGVVPAEYYTIQACTRRLAQNEPGVIGLPIRGIRHCYLRFTSLTPSDQYPTFTKSFGPGEAGPEHFAEAATTRCYNVGGGAGPRVYTFDQVMQVVAAWDNLAAQYGRYNVLDNNCCSHVIQTLNAVGLPVPREITTCNLGFN